ncbi:MAG: hypothetical protein LBC78_00025 [Oscillospiraceae bacterium]|jgi:cytochrome c oxidase subunit 4|nr:hypothetical protein [Oscillospiraceae bacterium]
MNIPAAYGLLNLGSLILGLIAWALPVIVLTLRGKFPRERRLVFSAASAAACAAALFLQILYCSRLAGIRDWSALMDITPAVALVSSILLAGTAALNLIIFALPNDRNGK